MSHLTAAETLDFACLRVGRYPGLEENGVRGYPCDLFARRAIGRISYPILLARAKKSGRKTFNKIKI